jgi:aminopeptidase YwaD
MKEKKQQILITAILLLTGLSSFSQRNPEITIKDLKADVFYLASDSLKGRKPGTPGADLAAEYIRKQFSDAGLTLMGEKGFQYFEIVTDVAAGPQNSLSIDGTEAILNKDFIPLAYSSNGEVKAPVVFVGYGFDINQDSLKWKDYDNTDVKGKWVMLLRGDPEPEKQDSKFIPYSELRGKILVAKDHGAAGVLVVSPSSVEKEDKLMGLHGENNDVTSGIPVINIRREIGNKLLTGTGMKVDSLESILNTSRKPRVFNLSMVVSASTDLVVRKTKTANVIGMIPGNDPLLKDEYILIGGHYDHLGFGGSGSGSRMPDTVAVHYGADDNASGTSMVIELAGKLASVKKDIKRSIIFVCFSAEEMGLIGSKYFVDHSPVDLKKIKAMFNFDMVGRFDKTKNSISISGTGTATESDSLIRKFEKSLPFEVTHSPDGYGPSDHASFYASNIPVFYFTTGAHIDYHTPFDQASRLDYKAEKTIGDFAFNIIREVDKMNHPLTFKESGKKESAGRGGRRLKVTLGIMPDFAGTEKKGLRIDGVTKDGPAYKSGMLKGDIIISINGMPVGNIYEYMTRLGKLKSGQTISVEVIRNEKHEVLIVQL